MCIKIADVENEDILQHFKKSIEFIHNARMQGGNVLVHWFV